MYVLTEVHTDLLETRTATILLDLSSRNRLDSGSLAPPLYVPHPVHLTVKPCRSANPFQCPSQDNYKGSRLSRQGLYATWNTPCGIATLATS
jgi:hypothetical protein